jgi:actin-related protein 6
MISYRQWNMMDETWLVNHVKERLALVALDYDSAVQKVDALARSYVLPDYVASQEGWVREDDPAPENAAPVADQQVLKMGVERIAVGEMLFRPSDAGLSQMGLGEGLLKLWQHGEPGLVYRGAQEVAVIGGCAQIPGFALRLEKELRQGLPVDFPLSVVVPPRPELAVWRGAAQAVQSPQGSKAAVSKALFEEVGAYGCLHKFAVFQ